MPRPEGRLDFQRLGGIADPIAPDTNQKGSLRPSVPCEALLCARLRALVLCF